MKSTFNERLAMILRQNNLTQKEAAKKAGVTEAAMSHYLKGDRTPRASVLIRMADALDTTTDYLMGGNTEDAKTEVRFAKRLIARNVQQMSQKEKMEIISILMKEE